MAANTGFYKLTDNNFNTNNLKNNIFHKQIQNMETVLECLSNTGTIDEIKGSINKLIEKTSKTDTNGHALGILSFNAITYLKTIINFIFNKKKHNSNDKNIVIHIIEKIAENEHSASFVNSSIYIYIIDKLMLYNEDKSTSFYTEILQSINDNGNDDVKLYATLL